MPRTEKCEMADKAIYIAKFDLEEENHRDDKHGGERQQSREDFRMEESCDLVVIGGGQAGLLLAQDLAAAGKQIVLVERKYLGESCVISLVRRQRPP